VNIGEIYRGDCHCRDAFFAADEAEVFVGRRFDADLFVGDVERGGDVYFHRVNMRIQLWLLGDESGIDVDDFALANGDKPGGFFEEGFAGNAAPARVGIGKEMADVRLAERTQYGVANGVHENVGVGMAIEAFGVRDFHAAKDEFAVFDQGVDIVANSGVNHGQEATLKR
jgi:hypothetical protein